MKIGALADATGVTTKTIRYYESIGLLAEPERTTSGYRDYDSDAVDRLHFVRDAQASGLALSEIASVLELKGAGETSCSHTASLLEAHLQEIDEQIERLQATKATLTDLSRRAGSLDPAACTDPNRCQVIAEAGRAPGAGSGTGG